MNKNRTTRRIRLRLAPPGSWADRQWRALLRRRRALISSWSRLRKTSPANLLAGLLLRLLPAPLANPLRTALRRRRLEALLPVRKQALALLAAQAADRPVVIFPPSLDWRTQLFQRPQQLALALARQGALVFYLQPGADPAAPAFQEMLPGIYLCNTSVEAFADFNNPTIYLLTWNRTYEKAFDSPRVIYDYVDDIAVFEGNYAEMLRDHDRLVRTARLVLTTAERLYRQTLPVRPDALLCPNGVEYDHFVHARQPATSPPPADLAPLLATGKPVIGYYGALAAWFDYPLLDSLCSLRPDLEFLLIGPDYDGSLPPALLERSNLHWLGVKPYTELPDYLRHIAVAMIPFQLNDITHSTSPLKLFEYMAGGKPVIITPMEESMRTPGVLVASDGHSFSQQIDRALQLRHDPTYLGQLDQVARQNTWDIRARQILDALAAPAKNPATG
jgi:glycosyltransferase involved in cell wall biosynthesis